jgi:hypothetical protein
MGSSESFSWQTRTKESIPFLPSTGSTATSTRICAVIWIIVLHPARHEANLPSQASTSPSTECASCFQPRTRTRSRNPPPTQDAQRPVQRMPAWSHSSQNSLLRQAAFSTAHNPTEEDEQLNTSRAAEPVPRQPPKAVPAASSVAAACCGIDPTGVEAE